MVIPEENKNYTYADYLKLGEDISYEVINGEVINMSPSPTPRHQHVADELTAEFKMFLRGKGYMAFSAPTDVCLFAEKQPKPEDIQDWVQPDLSIVCDSNKIGDKNIIGAPELIVEVLAPSTARNDRLVKFNSYEKAGVKEYWIVDPLNMSVEVYNLTEGFFEKTGVFGKREVLTAGIFPELKIDLKTVFHKVL